MINYKLGRLPRANIPGVPHLSSFFAAADFVAPPPLSTYVTGMPARFGMMMNDRLSDCTIAAYYHARQVWTWNTRQGHQELTEPDATVLKLYELSCGYDPNDPSTDQGGIMQQVLIYLVKNGAPLGNNAVHKLTAFFEVDPRNLNDIKRVIYQCGVCYIGFNLPSNVMPDQGAPPAVWELQPGSRDLGGHAVVLVGYDKNYATLISWGSLYRMSWEFFSNYTDEAYALCDSSWIAATGKTPLGMSTSKLEAQMASIAMLP